MIIRVFALFRIPVSYINPLLERFAREKDISLEVAFCLKPPDPGIYPRNLDYFFLDGAEAAYKNNTHSEREGRILQLSVINIIREKRPDVLFIGSSYKMPTTWAALLEAKRLKIPCITRMTVEAGRKRGTLLLAAKRIVVGMYCRLVSAGVYECADQRDYMLMYGMKEESLFFAPCAVDNAHFTEMCDSLDRNEIRRELGITEDEVMIVDVAELIPRKRPLDLIRATEQISNKGYRIKTFFLGDGELTDALQHEIKMRGIHSCFLTGRVNHEQMSRYLRAADIFVLPSENDASPKALNEAMNFSLAIIVSSGTGTARELCCDGVNGYVYQAGNTDQLEKKIEEMIRDPEKMHSMGAESRRIVSKHSYEAVINGWKQAIMYCV